MIKDRSCKYCNYKFNNIDGRIFSNHVKWCDKNPSSPKNNFIKCEYCSKSICSQNIKEHLESCFMNPKNYKVCKECSNILENTDIFCSSKCAATYNNKHNLTGTLGIKHEKEIRNCSYCGIAINISVNVSTSKKCMCFKCNKEKKYLKTKNNEVTVKCVFCEKPFISFKSLIRKTCSDECHVKLMSLKAKSNSNCGGETNYKRYYYKDILMDSTWEVKVAELMDSLNIKWERSKKLCLWWFDENNGKRRYHPDFYLPDYDVYLDTKNKYLLKQDEYKIKKVLENNKVTLKVGLLKDIESYINSLSSQEVKARGSLLCKK